MSPLVKGRVLGPGCSRRARHCGVCAWCGECYVGPLTKARCLRCDSDEIDWDPPPAPRPVHQHIADHHTPGTIAFSLLGGFVRGSS